MINQLTDVLEEILNFLTQKRITTQQLIYEYIIHLILQVYLLP